MAFKVKSKLEDAWARFDGNFLQAKEKLQEHGSAQVQEVKISPCFTSLPVLHTPFISQHGM